MIAFNFCLPLEFNFLFYDKSVNTIFGNLYFSSTVENNCKQKYIVEYFNIR